MGALNLENTVEFFQEQEIIPPRKYEIQDEKLFVPLIEGQTNHNSIQSFLLKSNELPQEIGGVENPFTLKKLLEPFYLNSNFAFLRNQFNDKNRYVTVATDVAVKKVKKLLNKLKQSSFDNTEIFNENLFVSFITKKNYDAIPKYSDLFFKIPSQHSTFYIPLEIKSIVALKNPHYHRGGKSQFREQIKSSMELLKKMYGHEKNAKFSFGIVAFYNILEENKLKFELQLRYFYHDKNYNTVLMDLHKSRPRISPDILFETSSIKEELYFPSPAMEKSVERSIKGNSKFSKKEFYKTHKNKKNKLKNEDYEF